VSGLLWRLPLQQLRLRPELLSGPRRRIVLGCRGPGGVQIRIDLLRCVDLGRIGRLGLELGVDPLTDDGVVLREQPVDFVVGSFGHHTLLR